MFSIEKTNERIRRPKPGKPPKSMCWFAFLNHPRFPGFRFLCRLLTCPFTCMISKYMHHEIIPPVAVIDLDSHAVIDREREQEQYDIICHLHVISSSTGLGGMH